MIDKTNEQTNSTGQPSSLSAPVTAVASESYTASVTQPGGFPTPPPQPPQPLPDESPTVAVSGEGGVPKWFYLVFGITLIVFFAVTTLLVLSLTGKKQPSTTTPAPVVQPTTVFSSPTQVVLPSPTLIVTPQVEDDEISDLENDLNSTDLETLDEDLASFDREL